MNITLKRLALGGLAARTASDVPLFAAVGLLSIGGAFALRVLGRHA